MGTRRSWTQMRAGVARRIGLRDVVSVAIPPDVIGRRAVVKLHAQRGRDQVAGALRAGGWHGFEAPMPTVFAACAAAYPGVVYDVGANTGLYAVVAARANRGNTVIAFEPFPPVRAVLSSNIARNRLRHRVRIEPFAIASQLGEAVLHIPLQDHGLIETSASLNAHFKEAYSERLAVQVVTLDFYDQERHPGRTTLVKIDVESMEADVLRGARRILKTHRPIVFCEVLPSGDIGAIERIRRTLRYTDIRLHPDSAEIGRDVTFDPDGWNHVLVPNEKIGAVVDLLERCALPARWAGAETSLQ